jgi:predicted transcriptional regulator
MLYFSGLYHKIEKPQQIIKPSYKSKKRDLLDMVKFNKTDKLVLEVLKDGELTLQEIVDKTGEKPKKIFKVLRKLFENELIDTKARKYKLISKQ